MTIAELIAQTEADLIRLTKEYHESDDSSSRDRRTVAADLAMILMALRTID